MGRVQRSEVTAVAPITGVAPADGERPLATGSNALDQYAPGIFGVANHDDRSRFGKVTSCSHDSDHVAGNKTRVHARTADAE